MRARVVGHGRHADRLGRISLAHVARHAGGGGAHAHATSSSRRGSGSGTTRSCGGTSVTPSRPRKSRGSGKRRRRRIASWSASAASNRCRACARWLARLRDAGWRQAVASSAPPANIEVIHRGARARRLLRCVGVGRRSGARKARAGRVPARGREARRRAGALCRGRGCACGRGGRAPRRHAHDRPHLHGPPARCRHRRRVARGPARGCVRSAGGERTGDRAAGGRVRRPECASLFDTPADRRVAALAWVAALAASFVAHRAHPVQER